MAGSVIYGWDFTLDKSYRLKGDSDDGSEEFTEKLNGVLEYLQAYRGLDERLNSYEDVLGSKNFKNVFTRFSAHKNIHREKLNGEYNYAFGIKLDEFGYKNLLLSNIKQEPTVEQKNELKNIVASFDKDVIDFFEANGEPKVFILWASD